LILRKIIKTVATRWQIFRLKYTKFVGEGMERKGREGGRDPQEKSWLRACRAVEMK